jgi:hypothetical protein
MEKSFLVGDNPCGEQGDSPELRTGDFAGEFGGSANYSLGRSTCCNAPIREAGGGITDGICTRCEEPATPRIP